MSHSGAAVFKKVSGMLLIDEESNPAILTWRSTDGDKSHSVMLNTINKLQATPASSDKMMLRLVGKVSTAKRLKDEDGGEAEPKPVVHMFTFNNRIVMDNIKETLQHIISRYKDEEVYEEKRRKEGSDAPTPQAEAPLINTTALDDSLSREKLLVNLKLQQSLLKENRTLMKTFQEAVIKSGLPPQEFWATRIPLLRAFALATSQKTGPYNVLSTIKPVASSDNKVNVSVSREKILTIFQNYPIVKKAYDDNVPKNFKEQEFWARFFSSKLFRKLRGERIMQNDRGDMIIDRYLTLDQEFDRLDDEMLLHPIKKLLDLEGNQNDDPEKRGNRPHFTMLPGTDPNGNNDGSVDILKGMNRLSEKMIKSLENEYSRVNLQMQDLDKEEREEILFSDLEEEGKTEYEEIYLRQRSPTSETDTNPAMTSTSTAEDIKNEINSITGDLQGTLDLTAVGKINSQTAQRINRQVMKAVKVNAKQAKHLRFDSTMGAFLSSQTTDSQEANSNLPPDILESARVLHGTCCEFLKHFYNHFQSGEPKSGVIVKKLYGHLKECTHKVENLLTTASQSDSEQDVAALCSAYLNPALLSINLAIEKYDAAVEEIESYNKAEDV
ncbi:AAL042Wp [Eremothecium gossypii ATCC 10895]|uniref:AAL042Wp n=1 Tax=Eremothecium gossypii (strain ATCC 10895 / CBS 109.51 / FGSC 9923 / NRRL Y-1056) TaxID=284811 RepID=Q75EX0_EREGS|nr:AAL042Wp [Eremothecium gossypii ATCC 10895]AAS50324.1 AAL042Wp [Eremothecium gossypii ATCC 10895]AEY94610.1 FAAL042Wp [Eremothecium gossypii FDAG1]